MATQAEYQTVAAAIRAWAVQTEGTWKESFIDADLMAGAKVAVDALKADNLDLIDKAYTLTQPEKDGLATNGFVVSDRVRFDSHPMGYLEIYQQDLPEVARTLAESDATTEDDLADFLDIAQYATMMAPSYTIQGGTTQVLRGIVARGLGLR